MDCPAVAAAARWAEAAMRRKAAARAALTTALASLAAKAVAAAKALEWPQPTAEVAAAVAVVEDQLQAVGSAGAVEKEAAVPTLVAMSAEASAGRAEVQQQQRQQQQQQRPQVGQARARPAWRTPWLGMPLLTRLSAITGPKSTALRVCTISAFPRFIKFVICLTY